MFDAHGFVEQVNARAWVRHDGRQGGGCMRLDDEHNFNQLGLTIRITCYCYVLGFLGLHSTYVRAHGPVTSIVN